MRLKQIIILSAILTAIFVPAGFVFADTNILGSVASRLVGGLIDITADTVFYVISAMMWPIAYIFGLILSIEGRILNAVLEMTISDTPIVSTGWAITRDLAYMFFVLALIFIAFTTILRIEQYRTQELIMRLILVALLINFSLVIGKVIIDFTQVIAHYFIAQASGGSSGLQFSESLANALQISQFYQPAKTELGKNALENAASIPIMVIAGLSFTVIFSALAVFIFAAAILLFLVRVIALWFLLIIAPIAWAAAILPDTRHLWSRWWKEFLCWAFFAPVYAFFMYLAILIVNQGGNIPLTFGGDPASPLATASSPKAIIQMLIVTIILFAGIKVAQSLGCHAGAATAAFAQKWGMVARDYTGRLGRRAAVATGAPQKIAAGLSRIPVLRQAARPLRKFEEREREARAQRINQSKERVKGWTKENVAAEYRAAIDPQTKAGLLLAVAEKRGGMAMLSNQEKMSGLLTLKNFGMDKEMMAVLRKEPTMAPQVGKTIEEVVRAINPGEVKELSSQTIENPEVARYLNPGQLAKVFEEGMSEAFAKAFPEALKKGVPEQTFNYLKGSPLWTSVIPELRTVETKGEMKEEGGAKIITAGKYTPAHPPEERKI